MFAAEFAHQQTSQNDSQRAREHRQKPNRKKRIAKKRRADFCQKNAQRRVVGITEGEMFRAGKKIKFIAEIAVTIAR